MKRLTSPWPITIVLGALLLVALVVLFAVRRESAPPVVRSGEYLVRVDSRAKGWQSANISVERGAPVEFRVAEGNWTHFRGEAPYNSGQGGGYICAEAIPAASCIEPVPTFPQGGLVGRVGGRTFAIGQAGSISAPTTGPLALRINDADEGVYDNDGALVVIVRVGP